MKIYHVITRLIIGGAQENTVLTCRGLVEKGHDVALVAGPETGPEGSLWDAANASGAKTVSLESLRRAVNPIHDFRAFHSLVKIFQSSKPDVVHTHSSKAGILGRAAASRAGVPVIVHTIHGMSFNRTQSWGVQRLFKALEQEAATYTSKFVTVAEAMTHQAVAAGMGRRDDFVTIRSGLEVNRFAPRPEIRNTVRAAWGVGADDLVVGSVARLFENKGYDDIISAMPRATALDPKLKFVWIGDGPQREHYRSRLAKLGLLDRVHMVGLISPAEVARHMTGFDMLVHASRWEGLPRAAVQALLTEVPCVSYDNDGAPEIVIPNQTGLLIPLGDTSALADAIVRLAREPALRHRLGANGRLRCLHDFDWRFMVERIEHLYLSLQS